MNSAPTKQNKQQIKTYLAALLVGCAAVSGGFAQSTTINFGAGVGQRDVRLGGGPVPDGNQVQIGYFTPGFDVVGNAGNVLELASAWNSLGSTSIRSIFGQAGRFGDTLSTSDSAFNGQKICLWIFQTTDNAAPSVNFQNLLGYGLYSSSALNWSFPQTSAVPPGNTTSINSSEVNQAYFGSYDSSHLFLTQVPEPSSWSLLLGGFLAFKAKRYLGQRRSTKS